MITPDNQIVRAVDTIDLTTIRSAVVDEDGHIRELPAAECRRFSWDEEVFKRLGVKDDCGNLARVENGRHVLPPEIPPPPAGRPWSESDNNATGGGRNRIIKTIIRLGDGFL